MIWKYEVPREGLNKIEMPELARVLSCGFQDGKVVVWASGCKHGDATVTRAVCVVAMDGQEPVAGQFIGTIQIPGVRSEYVQHVFDMGICTTGERG